MKKRYISLIIIAVAAIAVASVWYYISNRHTVVFSLTGGNYTLSIYPEGQKNSVATLKSSGSVWLKNGGYSYVVDAGNDSSDFNNAAIDFTIESDKTITVYPNFSASHLASLLTGSEQQAINAALAPYLSRVAASDYNIQSLDLYKRGQWAAGKIAYQPSTQEPAEIYRFVLSKNSDAWQVVIPPQIAIYSAQYPSVPRDAIDDLY